jgi:ribosome-binding factor A
MPSRRQRRVSEMIHRELSLLLLLEVRDPRLANVTITEVDITPDLLQARIYYTVLGEAEDKAEAQAGLESAGGYLRTALAAKVQLRFVPELSFFLDTSAEHGRRIDELLAQIAESDALDDQ